nr:hypothetical protein [Enterocloster clostridioformis]
MIRIAVCDDEPCFTEQIDHIIANHARDISLSPETVLYTTASCFTMWRRALTLTFCCWILKCRKRTG